MTHPPTPPRDPYPPCGYSIPPLYPAPRWARPRRRVGAVLFAVSLLMSGSVLAGVVIGALVWGAA